MLDKLDLNNISAGKKEHKGIYSEQCRYQLYHLLHLTLIIFFFTAISTLFLLRYFEFFFYGKLYGFQKRIAQKVNVKEMWRAMQPMDAS